MANSWYRHRIIKHELIPGIRFKHDPGAAAKIEQAREQLTMRARVEVDAYLRTHHPAQEIVTELYATSPDGLRLIIAITLFGPPDIKREILEELALAGEV
jgi:hypothetical protein